MPLLLPAILIILISLLFITYGSCGKRKEKYPGPGILETIKGFMNVDGQVHVLLSKWAEKYGAFFFVWFGNQRAFVINDVKLLRELFQLNEFSGRPTLGSIDPFAKGVTGLINSNGKEGQAHRTFAMATLKSFGFGKPQMNKLLLEEISGFMNTLTEKNGQPVCVKKMFINTITNTLWTSIASKQFTKNDPTMKAFEELLIRMDKIGDHPILSLCQKITEYFPWIPVWSNFIKIYTEVSQILEKIVEEHEATRTTSRPRDFIDAYLDKAQDIQDEKSCFYRGKNLVPVLIDFIIAGSDTMAMSMEWCTLHMMRNLDVQGKVQEELKRVVGTERLPTLEDRSNCIYTEATILEILRITPPATIAIPHITIQDTTIAGKYFIPKNSMILGNLYNMQNCKEVWGDPTNFRPERWLVPVDGNENENGYGNDNLQLNKNNENLVAFSVGKRRCTGEILAKDSLFLFFASLLSRFKITCPSTQPLPSLEAKGTVLCGPQTFSAIFTPIKKYS